MHSKRGLIALTAIAAALLAAVVIDGASPSGRVPVTTRLVPELTDPADITRITWWRPGEEPYAAVRDETGALALTGPAVADDDALADVVATLAILSRVRAVAGAARAGAHGLAAPRLTVAVELVGGAVVELRLGDRIPATDRAWVARADRADGYLIAGYAARALDRDLGELRQRRLLAGWSGGARAASAAAPGIRAIELGAGSRELLLSGHPARVHAGPLGGQVRADPARHAALLDALGQIAIARFTAAGGPDRPPGDGLSIRVVTGSRPAWLTELAPCPDEPVLRLVDSWLGRGCVSGEALGAVAALIDREAMFDRQLLRREAISRLTVIDTSGRPSPDGATARVTLVAHGRAWSQDDHPVEAGAVDAWLADVRRATDGSFVPARDVAGGRVLMALEVEYADGATDHIELTGHDGGRVLGRRGDEPIYLPVDRERFAGRIAPVTANRFRRRQILALDPVSLRAAALRRGGAVIAEVRRGELAGDWRVAVPAGRAPRAEAIAALRELARLRAAAFADRESARSCGLEPPRAAVDVTFDPGPLDDAVTRHTLELGRSTPSGCCARLAGDPAIFLIDPTTCAALTGPWSE